jgi:hypothetical protein
MGLATVLVISPCNATTASWILAVTSLISVTRTISTLVLKVPRADMYAMCSVRDIRVPHKGNIVQNVINGAFDVLDGFDLIREQKDGMRDVTLDRDEQHAFARSALALRYDPTDADAPAPITESQLLAPRRFEDRRDDLWTVFNRVQENLTKGGLHGRSRTGRSMSTRPITGIDQNVKLNRALWMLADAMRQMKA